MVPSLSAGTDIAGIAPQATMSFGNETPFILGKRQRDDELPSLRSPPSELAGTFSTLVLDNPPGPPPSPRRPRKSVKFSEPDNDGPSSHSPVTAANTTNPPLTRATLSFDSNHAGSTAAVTTQHLITGIFIHRQNQKPYRFHLISGLETALGDQIRQVRLPSSR